MRKVPLGLLFFMDNKNPVPEEHFDDYGDGSKPESSRAKFFLALLVMVSVVLGIYIIFHFYLVGR